MTELIFPLILIVVGIVILSSSIRIAGESERFAVFALGRFQGFKGPGLILIAPAMQRVHRLTVGDIGILRGSEFARFGDVDIPVASAGSLNPDQPVRIDGFDGVEPILVASSVSAKTTCPGCGHTF